MALKILPNNVLSNITAVVQESGALSSGFDGNDSISGPRSTLVRLDSAAGIIGGHGYTFPSDTEADYVVVARADKLITADTTDIIFRERDSGGAWGNIASSGKAPLATSDLIGITSQDYIEGIAPVDKRGYGIEITTNSGGSEAAMFSKLYFSESFDFGVMPKPKSTNRYFPKRENVAATPLDLDREYEISSIFTLSFDDVSRSTVNSFRDLYKIREWPLFLYDVNGDIWDHKLEHVLVLGWTETIKNEDIWTVDVEFGRLAHYG